MLTPAVYFDSRSTEAVKFKEMRKIDIEGIKQDQYEADNFGNVYSNGKIIKPALINSGYYKYALITGEKDPKYKNILAHRLIKRVFDPISNPDDFTINHINMDHSDNNPDNLEWVYQSENNSKKYEAFPNDGTSNYQSAFTFSQLESIVDGIDEGIPYKQILESIGKDPTDNNCDYIGNIKRGITYKKEIAEIRQRKFND